jgi:murein DD-endopeptidase MepM/ murein hydrolase activator NlpD
VFAKSNIESSRLEHTGVDLAQVGPHFAKRPPLTLPAQSSLQPQQQDAPALVPLLRDGNRAVATRSPAASPRRRPDAPSGKWYDVTIKAGDTLSSIFSRLDIFDQLHPLLESGTKIKILTSIFPGQSLHLRISDRGLEELIFDAEKLSRLKVVKTSRGSFTAEMQQLPVRAKRAVVSGTIEHSLYMDGNEAGLSDSLIMRLSELFGWDIDFALDIREGDSFTVIYEEYFRNGEKLGDGDIVAAEFINQGRIHRILRYTSADGQTEYYKPDGRNVRRPFLRTPTAIARISSYFDLQRRHPILNTIRAHRGVDYAAPTGTPIRATGDGIVAQRGFMDGYGNTIILSHGPRYTTLYGHMSAFASNTAVGQRVEQGQVIGYIGSTGLATGPHLHYEFRIDGTHYDPLTVALPEAQHLPSSEMSAFLQSTESLRDQLDFHVRHRIALN